MVEYGIVVAKGRASLKRKLPEILEDAENELTFEGRAIFQDLYSERLALEERIVKNDDSLPRRSYRAKRA